MKKTVKIITAFAVGAAAGSLLGLLLSPDKAGSCRNKAGDGKKRKEKDRKEFSGTEQSEIL